MSVAALRQQGYLGHLVAMSWPAPVAGCLIRHADGSHVHLEAMNSPAPVAALSIRYAGVSPGCPQAWCSPVPQAPCSRRWVLLRRWRESMGSPAPVAGCSMRHDVGLACDCGCDAGGVSPISTSPGPASSLGMAAAVRMLVAAARRLLSHVSANLADAPRTPGSPSYASFAPRRPLTHLPRRPACG